MNNENHFQDYPVDLDGKGLGDTQSKPTIGQIPDLGWNILREDISLPVAVLRQERLTHNLRWMKEFINRYQVKLAPHGKTTMSPALFSMQLDEGAWGITLATAPQVKAAYHQGIRRILMANQLVGRANMAIVAQLQQDPEFSFYTLVDSVDGINQLGQYFRAEGQRLQVLLELGVDGGRTGIRTPESLAQCLAALNQWNHTLVLAGVEIYEGVLKEETAIRQFLQHALATLQRLESQGLIQTPTAILSGAGSAWFDIVAEEWTGKTTGRPLDIILRPGCYLTHDVGIYKAAANRISGSNPIAKAMQTSLQPALQLWAYVLSLPEPGLAIMGLGKRDAAFDAGLPVPDQHYRPGTTAPQAVTGDWALTAMMDQHAFMKVPTNADIRVGDMVAFDISHPCLTFDKWRQLLIVDESYQVTDLVQTYF